MGPIPRLSRLIQNDPGAQSESVPLASVSAKSVTASSTLDIDKYVDKLIRGAEPLPPITWSNWYKEVRWFNLSVIVITPLVALYGALTTHLDVRTFWFCAFYYVFNVIGGFFGLFLGLVLLSNFVAYTQGSRLVRSVAPSWNDFVMTCHRQVITACGLTERTMLLSLSSTSLLWPVEAPFKEQSGGGLGATGPITGRIPQSSCRFNN